MSEEENYPRLCGGVFFSLLLASRKQTKKARSSQMGPSAGLSEPKTLVALIRVFYPDYPEPYLDSFKSITTKYKECKPVKSVYLPFDNEDVIAKFNDLVVDNYSSALSRMRLFTNDFLDLKTHGERLCKTLIALIFLDESIPDDADFFMISTGSCVTKYELKKYNLISPESFLLGVWHYILTEIKENRVGKYTAAELAAGNARWTRKEFYESYPNNMTRTILPPVPAPIEDLSKEKIAEAVTVVPETQAKYIEYLNRVQEKYNHIKTLLYSNEPHPFYDFYVCNNVTVNARFWSEKKAPSNFFHEIENIDIKKLAAYSKFVIFKGTGGIGKSMMMRHLLLDAIRRFPELKLVPVFVTLKEYNNEYSSILEYAYSKFKVFAPDISMKELEVEIACGSCILLFDGLDEINSECRNQFERELDKFTDAYPKSMIVVSSRPYSTFTHLSRFTMLTVDEFTKEQALELIDKLDYRPDEPERKQKFRDELDRRLYYTHKSFATNPLLLTIMLLTYDEYAEIPSKMHIFYREAYETLATKHDNSKTGGYKRELKTNLSKDRFRDYFAEFCAMTYVKEKYELTDYEIENCFEHLEERKRVLNEANISVWDFVEDLTTSLCLMYQDAGLYHFTHRSFQEYFCALYFSKQKDKELESIGQFFEEKECDYNSTFFMMYDMIPDKVEEYIFIPFLKNILSCDNSIDDYWHFLMEVYPCISYDLDVYEGSSTEPISFLYKSIMRIYDIEVYNGMLDLPFYEEFVDSEYVILKDSEGKECVFEREVASVRMQKEFSDDDVVGWSLGFETREVFERKERFPELIKKMEDDDFPLKIEYRICKNILKELKEKYDSKGLKLFDFSI